MGEKIYGLYSSAFAVWKAFNQSQLPPLPSYHHRHLRHQAQVPTREWTNPLMYCNRVVRLLWNRHALGLWGIDTQNKENCEERSGYRLCVKRVRDLISLPTPSPFPCFTGEMTLKEEQVHSDRTALATAQPHHPGTEESSLMSLEWFSFIGSCVSLQIAFRMNVVARTHRGHQLPKQLTRCGYSLRLWNRLQIGH